MHKSLIASLILSALLAPAVTFAAGDPWPASSGTDIGTVALASAVSSFDASDVVYHAGRGTLIAIGDDGDVAELNLDGSLVDTWTISGDPEDIVIADSASTTIYFADENAGTIGAFDLSTGALTGDTWSVSGYLTTADKQGIEAATFVPNGSHPYADSTSGGLFYIASQYNGDVAVLDIDTSTSGSVTLIDTFSTGRSDLAGLTWNSDTQLLYASYDWDNRLYELTADGTEVNDYEMDSTDQEGVEMIPDCASGTGTLYIADDGGPNIWEYTSYPIDTDTLYADVDADGLGDPASTALVCTGGSKSGYVTNSDDYIDTIPNAGVEISVDGKDNDGDGTVDEYNTVASNGAHPYYSTLSAADTSAYGTTITSLKIEQKTGSLIVTYSDSSKYQYSVWSGGWMGRPLMSATSVKNSAYVLVSYDQLSWRVYSAYDGSLVTSKKGFMTKTAAQTWAATALGL